MNLQNVIIQTERLKQIPITLDYVQPIFEEFTDEITGYMVPQPAKKIEDTKVFVESSINGLEEGSNLQLVVLDKETDEFLGCSGLHTLDKTPEFGIRIKRSAQKNGFGKEAILGIKKRVDDNLDYEYILYPVDKNNIASRKIAEAMSGKIQKKYDSTTMNNGKLNIVEYRIYPQKKQL